MDINNLKHSIFNAQILKNYRRGQTIEKVVGKSGADVSKMLDCPGVQSWKQCHMFAHPGQMTPRSASMVGVVIIITIVIIIVVVIITSQWWLLWWYQECTTGHTHSPMTIRPSVLKTMVIQVFADADSIVLFSLNIQMLGKC